MKQVRKQDRKRKREEEKIRGNREW